MEPAVVQLARPLTSLARNGGTQHASIHNDRVALTYMQHWSSFLQETRTFFLSVHITHQVPIKDESEIYVVGSELGLSGRFVRNLCDPVMQALMPLDQMSSVRFADIQALTPSGRTVPDVTFGLVNPSFPRSTTGLYMVGEFETPWTVDVDEMRINCPNPAPRLETLIGQVVGQMRMARVRYAFLTTYDFTVFVKRANDFSFLLSEPFGYDSQSPPLREMFVGFCLMAMADPKYSESHPDIETRLRGAPAPRVSHRVNNHHPRELPPLSTPRPITSTSVVVECGADMPVVADCVQQVSLSDSPDKAVWLADIRGTRRVLKCWSFEVDSLFETEAAVYDRLETTRPAGHHLFPKCIARGQIICSSLFPEGYAIILEYRDGERLCDIWHTLNANEQTHVQNECSRALHALRAISIRLDDPGMHNILYARESRAVTLLDFEVAVHLEPNTFISTTYEMKKIFRSSSILTEETEEGG